jgi:preprotein translocase subunit SecE
MAAEKASPRDNVLWGLGLLVLGAGLAGFFVYADDVIMLYRVLGLLAAVILFGFIVYRTERGREMFGFMRETDEQRRKVVWPTRQETFQTTLIVLVITIIAAILLFFMDSIFGWLIRRLIGTGVGN